MQEISMANTRQSTKRARQALAHAARNVMTKSVAKSAIKAAMDAFKSKDAAKAKTAYQNAIRVLAISASKGAMPATRAARKTSRLTHLFNKEFGGSTK